VIHAADADAVHVQSRVVFTAIWPVDPAAGTIGTPLSTVTWHLGASGAETEIEA